MAMRLMWTRRSLPLRSDSGTINRYLNELSISRLRDTFDPRINHTPVPDCSLFTEAGILTATTDSSNTYPWSSDRLVTGQTPRPSCLISSVSRPTSPCAARDIRQPARA